MSMLGRLHNVPEPYTDISVLEFRKSFFHINSWLLMDFYLCRLLRKMLLVKMLNKSFLYQRYLQGRVDGKSKAGSFLVRSSQMSERAVPSLA